MTTGNAPHLAMMASTNCAGTGIFSSLIIHKSQQTSPSLPRLLLRSDAVRITFFHFSTSMFGPPRNRNPEGLAPARCESPQSCNSHHVIYGMREGRNGSH